MIVIHAVPLCHYALSSLPESQPLPNVANWQGEDLEDRAGKILQGGLCG